MRFLGIDYGAKKVGVAMSEPGGRFAAPYLVLANNNKLIPELAAICREHEVGEIVLGNSLDYQGQPNLIMKEATEFKTALAAATNLSVVLELETLTTKAAERLIGRDAATDARAAALILQSYLDRTNRFTS
jgi:putative Holliday junction resolvase